MDYPSKKRRINDRWSTMASSLIKVDNDFPITFQLDKRQEYWILNIKYNGQLRAPSARLTHSELQAYIKRDPPHTSIKGCLSPLTLNAKILSIEKSLAQIFSNIKDIKFCLSNLKIITLMGTYELECE